MTRCAYTKLCLCLYKNFSIVFFNDTATTEIYTLALHDALPIYSGLYKVNDDDVGGVDDDDDCDVYSGLYNVNDDDDDDDGGVDDDHDCDVYSGLYNIDDDDDDDSGGVDDDHESVVYSGLYNDGGGDDFRDSGAAEDYNIGNSADTLFTYQDNCSSLNISLPKPYIFLTKEENNRPEDDNSYCSRHHHQLVWKCICHVEEQWDRYCYAYFPDNFTAILRFTYPTLLSHSWGRASCYRYCF